MSGIQQLYTDRIGAIDGQPSGQIPTADVGMDAVEAASLQAKALGGGTIVSKL